MTRGNTGHLHPINPEIDRTYHRSIIDAASGGALGDMTPFEARGLIEKMASNSQQFNARSSDAIIVRGVHDVGTDSVRQEKLERKIDSLTTLVTQLAMNQQKQPMARVCGICTSPDHYSDVCPSLLEPRTTDHPEAYAANIYNNRPNQQQQNYDQSSSRYNPARLARLGILFGVSSSKIGNRLRTEGSQGLANRVHIASRKDSIWKCVFYLHNQFEKAGYHTITSNKF
ncbi:hypothetical protein Lal_00032206 [Lupinus albus]|nr:hypothetical protein Lal_00032206 [Lupinus albus]